jgi:hypothetical protein
MSGKPLGREPKAQVSLTIDRTLYDLLSREGNKSALVEELVRRHYAKSLEELAAENKRQDEEMKRRNTTLTCLSCKRNYFVDDWLKALGDCPSCGYDGIRGYVLNKYGVKQ